MNKQTSKIWMIAMPTATICGLLLSSASAPAEPEDRPLNCSNRTLSGDYGFSASGVLIGTPGLPPEAQFRSVGNARFDGKGTFTGTEHTVINGNSQEAEWSANNGTYTVNSNCTGKLLLTTPNSPVPLELFFTIVKHGKEFETVLSNGAITTVYKKVD